MMRHYVTAAALASVALALPEITAAGWENYNGPLACPGGAPCIQLTVVGDNFGTTQGQLQKGDFIAPAPPPPAQPWDTPAVLFPSDIATRVGGNGVCVARSLYTGDGFAYRWCPFQRMEQFEDGFAIGSLGQYTGVTRDFNNPNCPGANAITGMTFEDGALCNGVPSSSTITFVCIDVLGAGLEEWGTRTPMVDAAIRSEDGCSVNVTLPLPGACDGARFALCGSAVASPNPVPSPSPQFSFQLATVTSWGDGSITALMAGTVPPPAVRIVTSTGDTSSGYEPEGPGALPPSASPIPVPFPSGLEVVSMTPQSGIRGACTPVTILLQGVNQGDITGTGFTHLMRMRVPTADNRAMNYNFQGVPGSVNGQQPVAPPNGLLTVTLQCLDTPAFWPSFPRTVNTTFGSFWSQASLGTHLIRAATCIPSNPNCLEWTFLPSPEDIATGAVA